jgi:hypothetical protein
MTVKRFIKAFATSACRVLVETDDGKGYLKALGAPEGPHTLACEWVGTQLAKWFGLPTFDFAILRVTDLDDIPFYNGSKAHVGPGFITRAESGEPWGGMEEQMQRLINPQDVSRLVVFDTSQGVRANAGEGRKDVATVMADRRRGARLGTATFSLARVGVAHVPVARAGEQPKSAGARNRFFVEGSAAASGERGSQEPFLC